MRKRFVYLTFCLRTQAKYNDCIHTHMFSIGKTPVDLHSTFKQNKNAFHSLPGGRYAREIK